MNRYDIQHPIAEGGMAKIYLALMNMGSVQRPVALKRLKPELQEDAEFVQMFRDEAHVAMRLEHPNIVRIFEFGELDDSLFIAMELLSGVTLAELIANNHKRGERVPASIVAKIAAEALAALGYAHGRGVIHRDVSPQNIMLTKTGQVKLLDFGIAKAEGQLHRTRPGLIKGKVAYMSPEQLRGGTLDGRADLFSLACVMSELATGRHPFCGVSALEVARNILKEKPSAVGVAPALKQALDKDPDARFSNASAMRRALGDVEAGMSLQDYAQAVLSGQTLPGRSISHEIESLFEPPSDDDLPTIFIDRTPDKAPDPTLELTPDEGPLPPVDYAGWICFLLGLTALISALIYAFGVYQDAPSGDMSMIRTDPKALHQGETGARDRIDRGSDRYLRWPGSA